MEDKERSERAKHVRKGPGLLDQYGNLVKEAQLPPARRIQSAYNQHYINKQRESVTRQANLAEQINRELIAEQQQQQPLMPEILQTNKVMSQSSMQLKVNLINGASRGSLTSKGGVRSLSNNHRSHSRGAAANITGGSFTSKNEGSSNLNNIL